MSDTQKKDKPEHKEEQKRSMAHRRKIRERQRKRRIRKEMIRRLTAIAAAFLLVILILGLFLHRPAEKKERASDKKQTSGQVEKKKKKSEKKGDKKKKKNAAARKEEIPDSFSPHSVPGTEPDRLIADTGIMVDGEELASEDAFTPWYRMNFGSPVNYTKEKGIVTFRGNTFRDDPTWGTADMKDYRIQGNWEVPSDSLGYNGKAWTGSGWTGQPLMMKWPRETKEIMNMYDWAKEDDDLVEVIYACLDGKVYFLDLKTGEPTRDVLNLGFTFKGSGALDPRGYPLLYLGSGYSSKLGKSRAFIISLIDCSTLYTFGNEDPFAERSVSFFDSSALVDAESDTLIYPGENGVLYLLHLNTQYDEKAGTLSVDPDRTAKWKYRGVRSGDEFWLGMEDSAAVYGGYLFIAENGGCLMCLDLNTLKLVWAQDTLDDTNSSPVLSVENGKLYLYISTSFHQGWRSMDTATIPIWKIDAETGEIVWQKEYECHTREGVSGGVESTIALGRNDLSDYIYVTVSMTEDTGHGVLACIRKDSGEVAWEHSAAYAWSSPACVYNSDGSGAVLYCSSDGKMYLLNGLTGEVYNEYDFGQCTIEASPAVYEKYLVVGTRDCRICGLSLE